MPNADYQSIFRGTEMDDRWSKAGTAVQGVKVNGTEVSKDAANKVNITLNKAAVGLGNVDNTSDADKPVSTAQAAINADLESRKANKDGFYEQMGVGYAKSLLGNGAATQETIDFRPSGGTKDIGTGVETLKAIKGNSVVLNQIMNHGDFSEGVYIDTWDGSHTITDNVAKFVSSNSILTFRIGNYPIIAGRKYLFRIHINAIEGTAVAVGIKTDPTAAVEDRATDFSPSDFAEGTNSEFKSIFTASNGGEMGFCMAYYEDGEIDCSNTSIIDLTQMFGAGNEPTSLDDARIKWLESFGYIPYNEGTLLNFKGEGLKTTGVNQWDGTKAQVLGGVAYRILGTYATLKFSETLDGAQTDITPSSGLYTPEKNGYIFATGVSNEFQIAIEHSGGDIPTTYHPYEEHTLALPITTLTSGGNVIFPDGMKSAGTAKDELYGNSLGVITKAIKRIGVVDLGTLNYTYGAIGELEINGFSAFSSDIPNIGPHLGTANTPNLVCPKYNRVSWDIMYNSATNGLISRNSIQIVICDTAYTDAASFKAAMQGVMLYYELAEPIEYTLDTPINTTTYVNDWGTEELLPQGKDAQGLPKTTPLNAEIVYAPNVQDAIRNLPKNYIGKESMDAILEAFKTAGIIASFTLIYDATSGKYNCSITKQS